MQSPGIAEEIITQHIKSLKSAYKNTYLIGDAALYTKASIQALSSAKQLFITQVPQKIKEAKHVNWVSLNDKYTHEISAAQ